MLSNALAHPEPAVDVLPVRIEAVCHRDDPDTETTVNDGEHSDTETTVNDGEHSDTETTVNDSKQLRLALHHPT